MMALRTEHILLVQVLLYVVAVSEGARYLGCFNERSIRDRLFKGDFQNFTKTLTHELCWENCQSKGFDYAGVQWARQCFCSSEHPGYDWLAASEAECDMPCRGNAEQKCGGHMRMGIFGGPDQDPDYLGCFPAGTLQEFDTQDGAMTTELCKATCEERRFQYFATEGGSKCFCGNVLRAQEVSAEECRLACAGDKTQICGGVFYQQSVYKTQVPEGPQYIGCFVERSTKNRLLQGDMQNFHNVNSPEFCQAHCQSRGFTHAGVQWGHECFCGDEPPMSFLAENQSDCNLPCPGKPEEMCGAHMRMGVYRLPTTN